MRLVSDDRGGRVAGVEGHWLELHPSMLRGLLLTFGATAATYNVLPIQIVVHAYRDIT
jgi:hypothetical protein